MKRSLSPFLRKSGLAAHVLLSVGWIGAVVAYLSLAFTGITAEDRDVVRGAYLSMELIGWRVIVPLSLAGLVSGLVLSLATEWGLLRHYWIVVKLAMTTVGTAILLAHMPRVSEMAEIVRRPDFALPVVDGGTLQTALLVHAAGGLALLTGIVLVSVFKPWGKTLWSRPRPS